MREKKLLKNYLIYFLFFVVVFIIGISNSYALETITGIGYLNSSSVIISDSRGNDISLSRNTANPHNITIRNIIFQTSYNFKKNNTYEYEVELANQYINNINSVRVLGNNTICQFMSLQGLNNAYLKIRFSCPNDTSFITIGLSNLSESAITNSYNIRWNNIYLWQIQDTLDTTPIIDSSASNTQDIIDNQNQNTQDIIDSQYTCKTRSITLNNYKDITNFYLTINGSLVNSNASNYYGVTSYIKIQQNQPYIINLRRANINSPAFCLYDNNKELISCTSFSASTEISFNSGNATYFRSTLRDISTGISEIYLNGNICLKDSEEQTNSINNLNDSINDDNVDDNGIASSFESFNDFLDDNSTITQLITLPITLYTAILNNVNGTCQPFNLGKLYGEDLILPCINISQYLGSSLWTMIDIIISGFAVYAISKKMIKVFNNFSSLREGDVIDD